MSDDSDPSDYRNNRHECPDCGGVYIGLNPLNGHNCPEKVPIEELEALADEWTKDASQLEDLRMAGLVKHKADELREVLEQYE